MALPIRNSRIKLSQGQMFWREVGQGTTLIFLHGPWRDGSQWNSIVEHLSSRYHCLIPDLLGFGESERPKIHHSIELQVESLAEYLEVLKLRQVYLIGSSVGGWIAASYALRYPTQVKGLVLLAPEGVQIAESRGRWLWARKLTSRLPLMVWVLRSLSPLARLLGYQKSIDRLLQLRQQLRRSPTACQLLFKRRQSEIQAELLHDRLSWLKLPILILQGEQDTSVAAALSRVYAKAPQAELQLLPGGEDLVRTAPAEVARRIGEFVGNREL